MNGDPMQPTEKASDTEWGRGEPGRVRTRWKLTPILVVAAVLVVLGGVAVTVLKLRDRDRSPVFTVTGTVSVGAGPEVVAVDPVTHAVYVANYTDDTVSVIDGSTRTVTATVDVGPDPRGIAVDPGTHTVYVTSQGDGQVRVIDGSTHTVTATVDVGEWSDGVAVDPGTHTVYVAGADGKVAVVDGTAHTVTATVDVAGADGSMGGVAVDPDTQTVYAAAHGPEGPEGQWNRSGTLAVIDASTNTVTARVPVGDSSIFRGAVAVDPGADTVYVANDADGTVSVIDASTNTVSATVEVGPGLRDVAVDPQSHNAYVASVSLSVIDGSNHTVTATVEIDPFGVAVDPGTNTVYASDFHAGTLSVIEPG